MNISLVQLSHKCNQCASELAVVKKKKSKTSDANFSEIVITTYRCSNRSCSSHKDIRDAKEAIKVRKLKLQNRGFNKGVTYSRKSKTF